MDWKIGVEGGMIGGRGGGRRDEEGTSISFSPPSGRICGIPEMCP